MWLKLPEKLTPQGVAGPYVCLALSFAGRGATGSGTQSGPGTRQDLTGSQGAQTCPSPNHRSHASSLPLPGVDWQCEPVSGQRKLDRMQLSLCVTLDDCLSSQNLIFLSENKMEVIPSTQRVGRMTRGNVLKCLVLGGDNM